jgi:hypothetical protein
VGSLARMIWVSRKVVFFLVELKGGASPQRRRAHRPSHPNEISAELFPQTKKLLTCACCRCCRCCCRCSWRRRRGARRTCAPSPASASWTRAARAWPACRCSRRFRCPPAPAAASRCACAWTRGPSACCCCAGAAARSRRPPTPPRSRPPRRVRPFSVSFFLSFSLF